MKKLTYKLDLRKSLEYRDGQPYGEILVVTPKGDWRWVNEIEYREFFNGDFKADYSEISYMREYFKVHKGNGKEYRGVWKDIVNDIERRAIQYYKEKK